ncbi:hypothetical protein ACFV4K_07330 [Nocardia sp. NPDC059764]|uniref:hypothetical protein n=1 Tax=Nocardia sp. NPDC059764 TaxID=3346939 RepID=UPI00365B98C1
MTTDTPHRLSQAAPRPAARLIVPYADEGVIKSVSSDDYELSPGTFDEAAQQNPLWVAWVQPDAIAARIDALFADTVPARRKKPPNVDRFSFEMIDWLCEEVFDEIFTDVDALEAPENRAVAGQLVTYFGEALRILANGEWFASGTKYPSPLFDLEFTPKVGYRWNWQGSDDLTDMFYEAVEIDGGPDAFGVISTGIYSRVAEYKKTLGHPYPDDEVTGQRGRS